MNDYYERSYKQISTIRLSNTSFYNTIEKIDFISFFDIDNYVMYDVIVILTVVRIVLISNYYDKIHREKLEEEQER